MTHGEAWFAATRYKNLNLKEMYQTTPKGLPKPMNREDAAKYYNTKLFAYWMDQLDDRLSIHRKTQLVSALMFGHTNTYKNFKEIKNATA